MITKQRILERAAEWHSPDSALIRELARVQDDWPDDQPVSHCNGLVHQVLLRLDWRRSALGVRSALSVSLGGVHASRHAPSNPWEIAVATPHRLGLVYPWHSLHRRFPVDK